MNWRPSFPEYKVADGGQSTSETNDDRLHKYLSPILLSAIREHESVESTNKPSEKQFWVTYIEISSEYTILIDCNPEESREHIIQSVRKFFPNSKTALKKLIDG